MSKKNSRKNNHNTSRAIVLREIQLSPRANEVIRTITPKEFVKQRKGRAGMIFDYVEIGYVISQLNKAFTPLGWQFEILQEKVMSNEVYVRGELTIKDYKTGYEVSKTQYGTKEIYPNNKTPIGDLLKAASSDALKKCASLFGIALDIYWKQLDESSNTKQLKAKENLNEDKLLELSLKAIEKEDDIIVLNELKDKLKDSKLYSGKNKEIMIKAIDNKINEAMK